MRRLSVAFFAAIAVLAVMGTFSAVPAIASQAGRIAATSSAGEFAARATSGIPTVSDVTPASAPVGVGLSQPPITRQAANFPKSGQTLGDNSITINPVKVGDLVVLSMQFHTTGISISGITGGNVGNWQRAVAYTNTGTDTLYYDVWWGVATAAGPSAVSVSYSADVSQMSIELIADSFTTGSPLPWAVVTSGGSSNPSTIDIVAGSDSNGLADQLYWGASEEESSATSSPTPGFTSNLTGTATVSFTTAGWLLRRRTLRHAVNRPPRF